MTIFILRQRIKFQMAHLVRVGDYRMIRGQYPLMNYLDCELDGFGGLKFLEKTGMCVYSPDIIGYFMDHCRSKAGVYVDPLLFEGKKKNIY